MIMKILMKKNTSSQIHSTPSLIGRVRGESVFLLMLLMASCADNHILPPDTEEETATGIAFAGVVTPSRTARDTRADASLVNRLETQLPPTATSGRYVGIFGAYTEDALWKDMTSPKPTADFFFNQQASVGANGLLSYAPERFWSNNLVGDVAIPSRREYASFWAYYPWNATVAGVGDYGISIATDAEGISANGGMGKMKFTMNPDASKQSDFMISELAADCSKDQYPLLSDGAGGWTPARVPFIFHHMLAQVRLYTLIKGADKVVYQTVDDGAGNQISKPADGTWFDSWSVDETIIDPYGNVYTKKGADAVEQTTKGGGNLTKAQFVALNLKVPDEANCVRWKRAATADKDGNRFADVTYSISFNNIHTQALYTPAVTYSAGAYATNFTSAVTDAATGSATVTDYIPNPYWFTFNAQNQRVMLNDDFMYDYFDDAPSDNGGDSDALHYLEGQPSTVTEALLDRSGNHAGKHYNYAPGNIILAVPQTLTDDDVPHVIIEVKGKQRVWNTSTSSWDESDATAKVTVNLLNRAIQWEAGFIYCYAFLDELMPGDDKVRGPETIVIVFDPNRYTDQW